MAVWILHEPLVERLVLYSIAVCDSAAGFVAVDSESYDAALDPSTIQVYIESLLLKAHERRGFWWSAGADEDSGEEFEQLNVRPQAYTASGFERLGACSSVSVLKCA